MRVLYYDCFSGISGDMNLGAMVDLGVDKDYLINELSRLNIDGYEINITEAMKKGISGTRVEVILKDHHHVGALNLEHNQNKIHEHSSDKHFHGEEDKTHHGHHEHRNLKAIEAIINNSELSDRVKEISKKIFMEVAKAEAKVHNKPLQDVHFHEVGALDSIVDIVGAAICFDYLKVDKILCSDIELGGGFVKCAHGLIPVPAPAVVEILKDVSVKSGAVQFETTTPTGAAILKAVVNEYTNNKNFKISKIGYGIGHRDLEIPNVLRVFLAESDLISKDDLERENSIMLECNIDDMNPEMYDYIMEQLFSLGAADVFLTPIIMKKGRPAVKLSVLCCEKSFQEISKFILKETSTLGFRSYIVEKTMLKRDFSKVNTKYGTVSVKNAYYCGEKIKSKPEYDECKKMAKENEISLKEIYNEISKQN